MYPRSLLALIVAAALVVPASGQQPSGPSSSLVAQAQGLKIVVIQGEGAVNSVRAKVATQPVVEVRDENGKPVAGAEVVFKMPGSGPGGAFNGWMRTQTAKTNAQGQASASGLTPNDELGAFEIQVTATSGKQTASAAIHQTNARSLNGGSVKAGRSGAWKIWAAVGAVAVTGVAIGLSRRNGGSGTTAASVPVTATPGVITVGGPR